MSISAVLPHCRRSFRYDEYGSIARKNADNVYWRVIAFIQTASLTSRPMLKFPYDISILSMKLLTMPSMLGRAFP